jgi:hypothetical protein
MKSPTGQQTPVNQPAYHGHEFEALKLRYEDQVALLRTLTTIDWQVFTSYITIQVVLGSWLIQHPIEYILLQAGLAIIDLTLASIAGWLLYNNYKRRIEVVDTVKNLNEALGFTNPNIYLPGKAINPPTIFRPWVYGYLVGVATGALGIGLIIFGPPSITTKIISPTIMPTITQVAPTVAPITPISVPETPTVIP